MARERSNSKAGGKKQSNGNGTTLGFEAKLWAAADALRNNMDAAEYKHVVLGLIFFKYTSESADPEHPGGYCTVGVFWAPPWLACQQSHHT